MAVSRVADDRGCQSGGYEYQPWTPLDAPWRGSQRQDDKTRLWRLVRWEQDGVPVAKAVSDVFGPDPTEADRRLALRFYRRYDCFHVVKRGELVWVEPTISAILLDFQQQVKRKNRRRRGDGSDGGGKLAETGDTVDTQQFPKDRVRSMLEKYRVLDGSNGRQDVRLELVNELATYRQQLDGKYALFKHRLREDYLALPYTTRYNDRQAAAKTYDRLTEALDTAAERYQRGTMVTLTAPPWTSESHAAAAEAMHENVARFMAWLKHQVGKRPANVKAWELQDNGQLHVHIALFGVRRGRGETPTGEPVISAVDVRQYWNETRGVGRQIAVQEVRNERGQRWVLHEAQDRPVSLRYYLGKLARELKDVAGLDAGELKQQAEAGDRQYWRHAVFWALEKRYVTVSPCLRETGGDDLEELPCVVTWEFVGVARYEQIPAHVRRNTRFLGTPPPGG